MPAKKTKTVTVPLVTVKLQGVLVYNAEGRASLAAFAFDERLGTTDIERDRSPRDLANEEAWQVEVDLDHAREVYVDLEIEVPQEVLVKTVRAKVVKEDQA